MWLAQSSHRHAPSIHRVHGASAKRAEECAKVGEQYQGFAKSRLPNKFRSVIDVQNILLTLTVLSE
jgi:hypothetical protein